MEFKSTEIAAAVIISIATLLSIVAAAIPDWIVISPYKLGLFQTCVENISVPNCGYHRNPYPWIIGTRAMVILGILCNIAALIMNLLVIFWKPARLGNVFTSATAASVFGGLFLLLGPPIWIGGSMVTFTGMVFSSLAAGPYLCYVAMICSWIHSGMTNSAKKTYVSVNQVAAPNQLTTVSTSVQQGYTGQPMGYGNTSQVGGPANPQVGYGQEVPTQNSQAAYPPPGGLPDYSQK